MERSTATGALGREDDAGEDDGDLVLAHPSDVGDDGAEDGDRHREEGRGGAGRGEGLERDLG